MLDALVHSLPAYPLLLLSRANAGENSVLGIAHVPKVRLKDVLFDLNNCY